MPPAAKDWHLQPHDPDAIRRLAAAAGLPSVVAQLVLNRGITDPSDAKRFLDAPLAGFHPPHLLPDIPAAAERILRAAADGRKICVYGDYDTDGVTGTAILVQLLTRLKADVQFHVPLRVGEGYGLNSAKLGELAAAGVSLVVSVDCGISGLEEAREAKRLGLELIVTDHHEMKDELPSADVLVHPRLPGSAYPFGGLSGAGVAFKLAWAVAQKASGGERVTPDLREYLLDAVGLAALGLVADVVPLKDENRIFVRHGLERIRTNPSLGLKALIEAAGMGKNGPIRSEDVSFKLAPRLNAAGRLDCAQLVVELLTTRNPTRAKDIADYLEKLNSQRQGLERKMTRQAREMVEAAGGEVPAGIVLGSPEWHPGVIGIVAGRIAEQFARPTLVIALTEGGAVATGSGRSVAGFPLHEALQACDGHLVGHGGHAAAAGFKIDVTKIDCLREAFVGYAERHFPDGPPAPRLTLDAEVPLNAITPALLRDIDRLEPYGAENPRPKFLASNLQIEGSPRRMGDGELHMSFRVRQGDTFMRVVAFGMGERMDELMSAGGACCLAFTPRVNEWEGRRTIELHALDLRPGSQAVLV